MASAKFYGTGRRKNQSQEFILYLEPVRSQSIKRDIDEYFGLDTLKVIVRQPFSCNRNRRQI